MEFQYFEKCKTVKQLSEKGNVELIKDEETGRLYVKKIHEHYDFGVYKSVIDNPVHGMPIIEAVKVSEGKLIVIERYAPGMTVEEHLKTKGPYLQKDAIDYARQLCNILRLLHNRKPAIIHRDIKPSNIIITPQSKVVLIDYNAAKFERNDKSTDTVLLGTFGHAAPEQYGFGTSGPQADIYALGVLLNLMLCTKLPSEEIYSANRKIKKIIEKCTQMNPKDRYSNVSALKKELEKSTSLYISWLPPGFRSLKFYKMIIAVIGYVVIYGFSIENASGVEGVYSSRFDFVVTMCSCLSIVFFYCNYLGFRKICPFVNSKKAFIRVIGYIIDPIIIAISLIIVLCFICELFGMGTMIIME